MYFKERVLESTIYKINTLFLQAPKTATY